ncbi:hypothetical protein M8J76_003388 [Diaphorina citri]|nr:hypothetical protein M8J76_003388 [Diaphorina citri]
MTWTKFCIAIILGSENQDSQKLYVWLSGILYSIGALKDSCHLPPPLRVMDGLRALDVMSLLQDRLCYLTGGRDRRGGPILSFPMSPKRERAKPDDYKRLLQYLMAIPS